MHRILFLLIILTSASSFSRTLFVSDIDDTIKVAHVSNYVDAARYALDSRTNFYGMSQVYSWLINDSPEPVEMVYLTKAPSWLLEKRHRQFLVNGAFPQGLYIPRTDLTDDSHKITQLRKLMAEIKPDKVILVGDNTEEDSDVFAELASEFQDQNVAFFIFVRNVSSTPLWHADQKAFLTSADLAWQLYQDQLISEESLNLAADRLIPSILDPRLIQNAYDIPVPSFVQCGNFDFSPFLTVQHNAWFELSLYVRNRCRPAGAIGL